MRFLAIVFSISFLVSGCKDQKPEVAERLVFDHVSFEASFKHRLETLDWESIGFSLGPSNDGHRFFIEKFRKEGDILFIYFEKNNKNSEAWNLHFIGNEGELKQLEGLDDTHTSILMDMLRNDLPWIDEKAKFLQDLDAIRYGILTQHKPKN